MRHPVSAPGVIPSSCDDDSRVDRSSALLRSDCLDPQAPLTFESLAALVGRVGTRGFEFHPEIGSTNDRALQLAANPATPVPFLVVADRQSAGRGRGANVWWSAPGALTFSVIVAPVSHTPHGALPSQLSLAAGLAVCDVLSAKAPHHEVRVKWPNDVFVGGRKVCGILVEVPFTAPHRAVIGAGLNVNNRFAEAPAELQRTAVSLSDATGQFYDRAAVLEETLAALLREVESVASNPSDLRERWAASCYLTGRLVHLESPAGRTVGLCLGIDSDGALLLQSERGPSRHTSGVIRGVE